MGPSSISRGLWSIICLGNIYGQGSLGLIVEDINSKHKTLILSPYLYSPEHWHKEGQCLATPCLCYSYQISASHDSGQGYCLGRNIRPE